MASSRSLMSNSLIVFQLSRSRESEFCYQNNMTNNAIKFIKSTIEVSKTAAKVLILVRSPFLVFAVAKMFPNCKFAVKDICGHGVLKEIRNIRSFESLDANNPKHKQSINLVLTDLNQIVSDIRDNFMKLDSKAVNCCSGKLIYHRKNHICESSLADETQERLGRT